MIKSKDHGLIRPHTDRQVHSYACWDRTLSGRWDLPCPIRLYLPPSQSASEEQLCLPGSWYTQEIWVSVRKDISLFEYGTWYREWALQYLMFFSIYSTDTVADVITLKIWLYIFFFLCLHNWPITWNVTQSLFFFTIYGSVSLTGKSMKKREVKELWGQRGDEKVEHFHLPLHTFPSSDPQLWCSWSW